MNFNVGPGVDKVKAHVLFSLVLGARVSSRLMLFVEPARGFPQGGELPVLLEQVTLPRNPLIALGHASLD